MKYLFVLLTALSISLTADAKDIDVSSLEIAMSRTLKAPVKIKSIRATLNPFDMFFNVLDNSTIKRISFTIRDHKVACDLIVYERAPYDKADRVRLEYCNSTTSKISNGLIYY